MLAERASILPHAAGPRGELDPAEASVAFGTDDVTLLHQLTMLPDLDRSTTGCAFAVSASSGLVQPALALVRRSPPSGKADVRCVAAATGITFPMPECA